MFAGYGILHTGKGLVAKRFSTVYYEDVPAFVQSIEQAAQYDKLYHFTLTM